jgi:hypothetical protein
LPTINTMPSMPSLPGGSPYQMPAQLSTGGGGGMPQNLAMFGQAAQGQQMPPGMMPPGMPPPGAMPPLGAPPQGLPPGAVQQGGGPDYMSLIMQAMQQSPQMQQQIMAALNAPSQPMNTTPPPMPAGTIATAAPPPAAPPAAPPAQAELTPWQVSMLHAGSPSDDRGRPIWNELPNQNGSEGSQ